MSVNDVFSGDFELESEINAVQEIQVLSGTFNAEYGEALSGVVNEVTKTAHDNYSGNFSAYTGDYLSTRKGLFQNIDHIAPSDLQDYEGLLSGPVPGTQKFMKFVLSGRYYYNDGYLYGKRVFNPKDSSNFSANNPSQWYIGATGDGKYVPMNYQQRFSMQGKLSFDIGGSKALTLQGIYQDSKYNDYDHQFVLDPDGNYTQFQKSLLLIASYTLVFNNSSFIDFNASGFDSEYKRVCISESARYKLCKSGPSAGCRSQRIPYGRYTKLALLPSHEHLHRQDGLHFSTDERSSDKSGRRS